MARWGHPVSAIFTRSGQSSLTSRKRPILAPLSARMRSRYSGPAFFFRTLSAIMSNTVGRILLRRLDLYSVVGHASLLCEACADTPAEAEGGRADVPAIVRAADPAKARKRTPIRDQRSGEPTLMFRSWNAASKYSCDDAHRAGLPSDQSKSRRQDWRGAATSRGLPGYFRSLNIIQIWRRPEVERRRNPD